MSSPNIKIGQHTYNDISYLRVDRVEGGTADYVYSGLDVKKMSVGIVQANFPTPNTVINRPSTPINISVSLEV